MVYTVFFANKISTLYNWEILINTIKLYNSLSSPCWFANIMIE